MAILNPAEKHIACVLAVDVSGSMSGAPLQELNEGLKAFGEALKADDKASGCADVCVIAFNHQVTTVLPFSPASEYYVPQLSANGGTCMNEAIITALDALEMRKQDYKNIGVDYWRPWFFLMTDGYATDEGQWGADACRRLKEAVQRKKVNFFPMGIGPSADFEKLKSYTSNGQVLKADLNRFKEAFQWLSNSLVSASNSNPSAKAMSMAPLPSTITIEL